MPKRALIGAAVILGAALQIAQAQQADRGDSAAREAESLYRQGAYAAALKKFEEAFAAGHQSPASLYQAANCYKAALSDEARELELKKKAAALLENEVLSGQAGVASYYYLAAIDIHSLHDAVKGVEVARKGIALVEKPGTALDPPAENLYRAARLYEFLGEEDKASAMDRRFQEAAAVSPVPVERESVRLSREKLADHLMRAGSFAESAEIYRALVEAEPVRDPDRHKWGLALLKAGRPEEAAAAWRGAVSDEYRTELAYLEKVVSRYVAAGKPRSSSKVPDAASLTDQALAAKVVEAGAVLRPFRQAAESAVKESMDRQAQEAERRSEEFLKLSPEERKARWLAKLEKDRAERAASGGTAGQAASPAAPAPPLLPEKSPEWIAAEREFFFLLTEYAKRGQLIRLYCFQSGIADLVFR